MKIEGTPKPQASETRRFSAAKASPKAAGKSFGEALKKAASEPAGKVPSMPEEATNPVLAPGHGASEAAAPQSAPTEASQPPAAPAAGDPASFEDHMELVKLRLKSGYYNGSNIDEALSEKLTGYFDELA